MSDKSSKYEAELLKAIQDNNLMRFDHAFGGFVSFGRTTAYNLGLNSSPKIKKALGGVYKNDYKTKHSEEIKKAIKKYKGAGYVYLVHCVGFDYYKIGISKCTPEHRMSTLQSASPHEYRFLHLSFTPAYKKVEVDLHNKYANKRVRGEWFEFTEKDLPEVISSMTATQDQMTLFDYE